MKLIKTNSKYTYEIESNYKIGDEIIFTDKSKLEGDNGIIIGIVSFENHIEYVVRYRPKARGGRGNYVLCELPWSDDDIFTDEQIKLKLE